MYIYPTVYICLGLNCISNFFPHSQRSHLQGIFPENESEVIVQAHKPPLTTGNQLLLICLLLVGTEVSSKSSVARGEDSLQLPRSIYDLHLVKFTAQTKNGLHALNAAVNYKRPEAWWLEAVGPNCRKRGPAIFQKRCAWSESCRDEQQSETKYCKSERQSGSIEDNKCWSTSPIIAAAFCPWLKQWPLFTVYRRASPWQPGGWRRYRQELFPLA